MGLDKKQLPQLIVLGVLVVVCMGYISFKLVAPKPAAVKPAQKSGAQAPDKAELDEWLKNGQSEPDALALLSPGEFPNLSILPARRDPFSPQRMPGDEETGLMRASANTGSPRPSVNCLPNPFKENNRKLPSLSGLFGNNNRPSEIKVLPIGSDAAKADNNPEFVLTGVVRGEENVAIIRVGKDGRYVVKEGQMIDGRYVVTSITDDCVVLVYKNRSIYLKLGGVTNAS